MKQVDWTELLSWPRADAVRTVAYEGTQRDEMQASFTTDLKGSYVVPRDIYCSRRSVPTAAVVRSVGTMHQNLFYAAALAVSPILSEPARAGLMIPVRLRRGLEDPNGYCLLKAVYAMSIVSGHHITVSDYLQWRTDLQDESWWSIRLAQ